MGPFVLLHVALVGFFLCAALYALWTWSLVREDRTLLVFSAQSVLCAVLSAAFVAIGRASDPHVMRIALMFRVSAGLCAMAVTAVLISRLTGWHARAYVRFVTVYAVTVSLISIVWRIWRVPPVTLGQVTLPWGEVMAVPLVANVPWWLAVGYAVVASVNVFGLLGALRLVRRDRVGGVLIGLAVTTGLLSTAAGIGTDFLHAQLPYVGDVPFAFWVVLIAFQLSRENARIRQRQIASEQRLRGIFDHTLHFMGLLDVHGVVLEANRPVLRAAGVEADDVLGKPFWDTPLWAHSAELRDRVRAAVTSAAAGQTVRFETWHPLPGGGIGHVDFSLKPVVEDDGHVVLLIPEGRDVTELRSAHLALRESEVQFRALIDGLDVGVVLLGADDHILVCNPAATAMLGLTEEQMRGSSSGDPRWNLVREDGTPYPLDGVPSVMAARTQQPVRNAIVGTTNRRTGAHTWLQVTATPHLRDDGTLRHVLVTMVDVTDRKRAEDAVRSSSRRLALAISATSDAVWEWNYKTGETYYSPRWYEMLGLPADTPMTIHTWTSLCHPDDLEPTLARIDEALNAGRESGYEVEFRIRRADGSWAWVLSRGNAVERDAQGAPVVVAGTSTDITQRKEAESQRRELEGQLAQAQRMESMGRLAGGIAHDFNNILTIINGYTDLLLDHPSLALDAYEMLDDIRSAGERAAALTRQLLTFSRHQVVDPDIVDLSMAVSDTERMLQRLIGEHIRLQTELAPQPLWTRADPGQLGQVVVNLAVNARDAMPQGGSLTVRTALVTLDAAAAAATSPDAQPGQYAVLSVSDTGTGIPPEMQRLVFEPFFTTKGPGKGTGLGLATVHGIAQQCGGFMSVTSRPGAGTTFTLYLPSVTNVTPQHQPKPDDALDVNGTRTVLMVEDEAAVRGVVGMMLHRMGFEVLAAESAEAALNLFSSHHGAIDLLLTDVIMPGLNGRQLAERLMALKPGLRVLYMSGYTDDVVVQQVVLNAGAAYPQKPFDADTLARKVRQALEATPPAAGV